MESIDLGVTRDDEQGIVAFMTRLSRAAPDAEPRLVDGQILIAKAHLLRRWESERRVQMPLDVMEPIQILAGLAAAALLIIWTLPSLVQALPVPF